MANEAIKYLNRMKPEDRGHFIEMVRYQSRTLLAVHQNNDRVICLLALMKLDELYPQPVAPQTCGPCCNC